MGTNRSVTLTGISSVTVNGSVINLPIPRPLRRVGNVRDVCVTRQNYEGAEKLVVIYNVGYIESYAGESITTAWISSTGELSTGAEIAYVLGSPEIYTTDPIDFDNAAGPLTVMTGGEVEVRMTELMGTRSDVSNNTVSFTEAAQDADIQTGEKLSILFGKIKKRFSVLASTVMMKSVFTQVGNPNLLDNSDFTNPVNQRGDTEYAATGYCIDRWIFTPSSGATLTVTDAGLVISAPGGTLTQKLEHAAGASVTCSVGVASGSASASYDDESKTFAITVTGATTLTWAKLEKGSVATPYVPKGYGAELAECIRYFQKFSELFLPPAGLVNGYIISYSMTFYPMRVSPSVNFISVEVGNLGDRTDKAGINYIHQNSLSINISGQTTNPTLANTIKMEIELSADL